MEMRGLYQFTFAFNRISNRFSTAAPSRALHFFLVVALYIIQSNNKYLPTMLTGEQKPFCPSTQGVYS